MKWIISLLLLFATLYGNEDGFLEPDKAFIVSINEQKERVSIDIKLDKSIYLYDDKIQILANGSDITKKVFTRKPTEYDGFIIQNGNFTIDIPKSLLKTLTKDGKYEVVFNFQGCSKEGLCYAPMSKSHKGLLTDTIQTAPATIVTPLEETSAAVPILEQPLESNQTTEQNTTTETATTQESIATEQNTTQSAPKDETSTIASMMSGGNIFLILATFFGFGLLLSLTPCIFPMIPILSSIIVKHSNNNDGQMSASRGFFLSLVYVLSMAAAYTIAGILAGLFGANIQAMLQNPYVLIGFAAIFVTLAFSLFGYFSLELPQSFQNKINNITGSKSNNGIAGVAIMGFLSALIVGPCVAPPLAGALMYIGQTGDAVLGGLALFVMSLGLGMPLLVVGAGAGKYMPKTGGWMETVSKSYGIVMLGLAIYMLDRILDPMVTIFLWAILLIGAALYLQEFKHIVVRIITTLVLIYGVVLFIGALSGATNPIKPLEKFTSGSGSNTNTPTLLFEKAHSIAELDQILSTTDKPVMIDFWASWCVSCKELDALTLSDPSVIAALQGYRLIKLDVTKNTPDDSALMKKYGVFGPPALIFFDANGTVIPSKRIVGYKNPQEFLEILSK